SSGGSISGVLNWCPPACSLLGASGERGAAGACPGRGPRPALLLAVGVFVAQVGQHRVTRRWVAESGGRVHLVGADLVLADPGAVPLHGDRAVGVDAGDGAGFGAAPDSVDDTGAGGEVGAVHRLSLRCAQADGSSVPLAGRSTWRSRVAEMPSSRASSAWV